MNEDLKVIKKKYGEKMANLCRTLFPTLLEQEGLLSKLLLDHFDQSHSLYEDIINQHKESDFKNYIYSLIDVENKNEIVVQKTPKELLSEAGYDLYECRSEEEIQRFKKYYKTDEELCTFDGGRLDRCHIFFAVKKDVDQIKRDDFKNPKRQDLYGTSVISIQFTRDQSHTLSIKNRYNHTVNNPDATYSNNLDNIINGLTESFEREYGLIQEHKNNGFELEGYVRANDGKYYKYNKEIANIYYCRNNVIIDNFEVKKYEKEKYIVFDYFILDLVNKEIKLYNTELLDSFPESIEKIDKIEIENKNKYRQVKLISEGREDIKILLNEDNELIGLTDPNLKKVGDRFLFLNESIINLNLSKLENVGEYFLGANEVLNTINFPQLKKVGKYFLCNNISITQLNLPNLNEVGYGFLYSHPIINESNYKMFSKGDELVEKLNSNQSNEIEELKEERIK